MAEQAILFGHDDVRAILDGRKTMFRRPVEPQPPCDCAYTINGGYSHALCYLASTAPPFTERTWWVPPTATSTDHRLPCPYGKLEDLLWVQETWATSVGRDRSKPSDLERPGGGYGWPVWYRADESMRWRGAEDGGPGFVTRGRWRRPAHMPRWASRLTLRMTGVRVEQLQSITESDARVEGVYHPMGVKGIHRVAFEECWYATWAKRGFG